MRGSLSDIYDAVWCLIWGRISLNYQFKLRTSYNIIQCSGIPKSNDRGRVPLTIETIAMKSIPQICIWFYFFLSWLIAYYPATALYICCVQHSVRPGISPLRSYSKALLSGITLSNIHTMTSSDQSTWCRGINIMWQWHWSDHDASELRWPDRGTTPRVSQARESGVSWKPKQMLARHFIRHMMM